MESKKEEDSHMQENYDCNDFFDQINTTMQYTFTPKPGNDSGAQKQKKEKQGKLKYVFNCMCGT